jgi:DNA-binding transcriptional MerR regulator
VFFPFTLNEIKDLLELRVEQGTSCISVVAAADQVIERIEEKVRELPAMRRAVADLRACCAPGPPQESVRFWML